MNSRFPVGDATLIREVLGWQPQIASLERITETAWAFELARERE